METTIIDSQPAQQQSTLTVFSSSEQSTGAHFGKITKKESDNNNSDAGIKKTTLESYIKIIMSMQASIYTKKSWSKLMRELPQALRTKNNETASSRDIDKSISKLRNAINTLRKAEREEKKGDRKETTNIFMHDAIEQGQKLKNGYSVLVTDEGAYDAGGTPVETNMSADSPSVDVLV